MDRFLALQRALNRAIRTQPWLLGAAPAATALLFLGLHLATAAPARAPLALEEARELGEGVGTFVTVVGVIYALMLGFTFQQAFTRQAELRHRVTAEASCLRNLVLLGSSLRDGARRGALARRVRAYVEQILASEFPPPPGRQPDAARTLYGILPELEALAADGVRDEIDRVTLDAIHQELRDATRLRSERRAIAARHLPRIHWFQIELLSTLILVGFLLLDMRAPRLEAILFGLSAGAITVLYLSLFDLDYPFDGLWRVEPTALRELADELASEA